MEEYKIPTNVKQIGNVDNSLRIYIEDYVYSYLVQYAKANMNEESIAVLIGRCMIIDGKKVLFISGAIQGLYAESKKGIISFSNETYNYIEEQRLKHFKGLEVVGWMLSQPGYGTYLSSGHMNYHIDNFKKPYQVMFVLDTVEKMNTFFQYDKDEAEIKEMEGFFVFYEKNQEMQEYMAENKIEVKIEDEVDKIVKVRKPEKEDKDIKEDNFYEREESKINIATIDKTKKININKKENIFKLPNLNPQLLAGGLILTVMATMSINSVKSENKIVELEENINVLTQAYNMLVTHVNNSDNVSQVFASSDIQIEEPEEIQEMPEENKIKTNEELDMEEDLSIYESEVEIEFVEDNLTYREETEGEIVETFNSNDEGYYIVKQGDSLIGISRTVYGTDNMQQAIMDANDIQDPNKIYFGMKLLLP